MAVFGIDYGTLAIEVGLVFNFLIIDVFPFPPRTEKLLADLHVNRQGASKRFLLLIIRQY
jgi:hypothetical protein